MRAPRPWAVPSARGFREATPASLATKGLRQVATFCDLCFWKCGAIATVRNSVLWKIEGNPDDPLSRGRLCPRGTGGVGAHFDSDRLRAPLIRRHVRGAEQWTEVTWDEWRYQPLLLNGVPTKFVLTVTVHFRLQAQGASA